MNGIDAAEVDRALHGSLEALADLEIGVAASSFQTEGGLDGPGQPATNWRAWAEAGRVEKIGPACDLWLRFDEAVARLRALGLHAFRTSIEWARVMPFGERCDARAIDGYAHRLGLLRAADIEPIVTLQHFTHPAWLGADFWLDERAPEIYARYAWALAEQLGDAMVRRGRRPVARWVTINEPNMLALATYVAGVFPHRRGAVTEGDPLGAPRALRALDAMLAAHVRAYRAIHEVHAQRGWPRPDVTFNLYTLDVYALGRCPFDLVRAGERGVARTGMVAHLATSRAQFERALFEDEVSPRVEAARAIERTLTRVVSPDVFDATLRLVLTDRARAIDSLGIDVYDPWTLQQARGGESVLAAFAAGESLSAVVNAARGAPVRMAEPWEWGIEPEILERALAATHAPEAPLPLDVLENGMADHRVVGATRIPRSDGATRSAFVRGYTLSLVRARLVRHLPVRSYCHWTLVDNYELGRYAPRFGLYALGDPVSAREAGAWGSTDAQGEDAASVLGAVAQALPRYARPGSFDPERVRSALRAAWTASRV